MHLRIGSLFAGIGGLELGLEWAGVGHTTWQVERDTRCQAVLAKHWPNAIRFDNVRTVGAHNLPPVDLICGGFPCQDVSSAGARAGLAGDRSGLWFEYERIVRELRPAWVVVENVASGADRWVDVVMAGLARLGYACLPIPLAAADVGAPHERARVFIVAARDRSRAANVAREPTIAPRKRKPAQPADTPGCDSWRSPQPPMVRVAYGVSHRLDIPMLGNAVVPQCAQVVGHVIRELAATT